jgi:uncharacterized protein YndB with AHSA1/START domain
MKWVLIAVAAVAVLIALVALIGSLLPKGHVASRSAKFRQSPEAVWKAITDVASFPSWRSDVQRVEMLPDRDGRPVWKEISRRGALTLEVVEWKPPERLVGRIADPDLPFGGTWTYEIAGTNGGSTLTITERGEIYNPLFRFLARAVFGYHATMEAYLRALGKKFGEDVTPVPSPAESTSDAPAARLEARG